MSTGQGVLRQESWSFQLHDCMDKNTMKSLAVNPYPPWTQFLKTHQRFPVVHGINFISLGVAFTALCSPASCFHFYYSKHSQFHQIRCLPHLQSHLPVTSQLLPWLMLHLWLEGLCPTSPPPNSFSSCKPVLVSLVQENFSEPSCPNQVFLPLSPLAYTSTRTYPIKLYLFIIRYSPLSPCISFPVWAA